MGATESEQTPAPCLAIHLFSWVRGMRRNSICLCPVPPVNVPIPKWVVHLPQSGISLVVTTAAISRYDYVDK